MEEVLDLLELKKKENIMLYNLPEGVRRRFEVARGFMTCPDVVFLDEPTIGFDIKARMDLWSQIRKAKEKEGATVVLTTHYIEEADYLCDRVAIIDKAKIIAIDTPRKLKEAVGEDLISLQIADEKEKETEFTEKLKELDWVKSADEYGNSILLNAKSGEGRVADLVDFADKHGFVITSVDEHEPSLEDVFVHFTGRTIREAEGGVKEIKMKRSMRGGEEDKMGVKGTKQRRPIFEGQPIYSMWLREVIRFFRMKPRVIAFIASPFTWLILLGVPLSIVFKSSSGLLPSGITFFAFVVPGILGMSLLFGGTNSGVTVLWDKEFGFLKEVMVAPVRRTSLMIGRSFGAMTISVLQCLVTAGVGLLFGIWLGFHIISVAGFFLAIVFMIIAFFAAVGFGLTLGALIEETEGFMTIVRVIEMPLFFLSGGLLPINVIKNVPVLYQIQFLNPLTYGVDGIRGALTGVYLLPPWVDFTVIVAVALLFLFLGTYAFSKMEVG
jgi:daunorubicin resistance ABC transporter membrane protein